MKFLKNHIFLLAFVLLVGVVLRLYQLGFVPASLNWDEVSLGYNAYSILTTGRDEYGEFMPLVLRSYDDYKPALYVYLTIPFVALLGLTEQAVRLPSALAGIGAIIIVYFLVSEILGRRAIEILGRKINVKHVAILTSFLLSISPWHIQFSRIAFESNVGLTVNLLAFLLFLKGLRKHFFLPLAFFISSLNVHMYQSERVFSPLLMIALSVIFYKTLLRAKKWFAISIVVAFLAALPLLIYMVNDSNALMRAKGVSVFSQQSSVERSAKKLLYDESTNNIIGKIFDNRRVDFAKATIGGYISHFDLNWLFITGDIARHHAPAMGLLYIFELPFLFIGIYLLVFLKIDFRYKLAFFVYFLLVPIPASITSGVPHAVRTLNFAWTWEFFISLGIIYSLIFAFRKKTYTGYLFKTAALLYMLFAFINFLYYLNQYFVQLNYFTAKDWLYGYKQAISYIIPVKDNYQTIIVENEVPFDQSYMFFLFYMKVDPSYYQSLGGTRSGGFKEKHRGFYNFVFKPVRESDEQGKVLLMGRVEDLLDTKNLKIISYPDMTPAIAIGERN